MNPLRSTAGWHILRGKLRQKCARIVDNDRLYAEGKEEELIGQLQRAMKLSKDKVRTLLHRNHGEWRHL